MSTLPSKSRIRAAVLAWSVLLLACGDPPSGPEDDGLEEIPVSWLQVTLGKGGFSDFTCGLAVGGAAYCWGVNGAGQLGYGDERPVGVPRPVLGGLTFASLEAGWRHTCGIDPSGAAYCWGAASIEESNEGSGPKAPEAIPGGRIFESLAAHNFQTCGLMADASAWCWSGSGTEPTPVPGGHTFLEISVGSGFQCGIRLDGVGMCWGSNRSYQLGNGALEDSDVPIAVVGDIEFVTLSAGSDFTCGLDADGVLYCWGSIPHYEPTTEPIAGGTTPAPVSTPERFVEVSVGSRHACALTEDGRAFCWGEGAVGQLGTGSTLFGSNVPVPVAGGLVFETLDAGGVNTCGTTAAGEAWCWGSDSAGQLGRGTDVVAGDIGGESSVPVRVLNPRG